MSGAGKMTEADLVRLLSERFYENFADETARAVLGADAADLLYDLVASRCGELPKPIGHKVLFRGAYVLERIYFSDVTSPSPRRWSGSPRRQPSGPSIRLRRSR